jgi:AbrB family looped-hinge helix DNA binding protein
MERAMLMKVHDKGQVVIPSRIRKLLGIEIGDVIDVDLDAPQDRVKLTKPRWLKAHLLAGSLSRYNDRPFPHRAEIREALAQGLAHARQKSAA